MKYIYLFTAILVFTSFSSLTAQNVCNQSGNIMIFTNYDGGVLNVNVDQNIPNLVIGVVAYEATSINLSGAFVGNVTAVHYAGYNGTNNPCGGVLATSINGAPGSAATSTVFAPTASLNNANGYGMIICGYSCNNNVSQGGCNTVDQIEAYFLNLFPNSSLFAHRVQYGCWSNTYSVSAGGSCCPVSPFLQGSVAASQTVCAGATITPLTSSVAASGGTGAISYQWESSTTSPSAGFSTILSATSASYSPPPIITTTYFRRGASTPSNSTIYSNVVTISVSTIGDMLISGPSEVCLPAAVTLTASSVGAVNYSWSTSPSMGPFISAPSIVLSFSNPATFTFTCTTSNAFNCTATGSFALNVLANPTVIATGATVCAFQPATLTATGLTNYQWLGPANYISNSQNAFIPSTTNSTAGSYTVTGQDANGCPGSGFVVLNSLPLPVISCTATHKVCKGQSGTISMMGASSYTLMPGNSVFNPTTTVSPSSTTTYTIEGVDGNGCKNGLTATVQVDICAGLEGLRDEATFVSVFPNPAGGTITIKIDAEAKLLLVNSMGQVCRELNLNHQNNNTLTVSDLEEGVYYLVNKDTKQNQKVVVLK